MSFAMSDQNHITDRAALLMHRARVTDPSALFLHQAAAEDVQDRLSMINRTFTKVAVVTPFADVWRGAFPDAVCVADDDILRLEPGAHDLVIHAMALHWANDPVGQLIQCRRSLQPDGLCLVPCFGGNTLTELRAALGQAEIEVTGGLSPRVAPMGDIRDLGALLQRAGFAMPVADSATMTVHYDSALHLMRDLRAMGETNALNARLKTVTQRAVLLKASEIYANSYATEDGRIPASFEIVMLSGWAPDESQPKPLRPGSASQRLADSLGTLEIPLKD
ncbi:Methyltransferase domain-containing protein [Thalassococcus halodurans]|uniref:Methyltransferase domain-containing protein n=2 Tax=Thalassococcus halodurans TaxID=373675 RepID=A0A1H5Z524_9RHOB|nr:Methyltransferase domain-containing protein [Thalassococcus halodurans]